MQQTSNISPVGGKILVTDDDHILRAVAGLAMTANGFEYGDAEDGDVALQMLAEDSFDLLLLDLDMPRVSGFEVIEKVRADSKNRHLPIIVATGRDDMTSIERAFTLGATSFVTKPIDWNIMAHHMRYVLRSSQIEAEVREAKQVAELASSMKGNLINLISHEFRTPMHAITGFSTLIESEISKQGENDTLSDYVSEITHATRRLDTLLGDVLFLSNSMAGSISLNEDRYSLNELILDSLESSRTLQSGSRDKPLVNFSCDKNVSLSCDKDRFQRALRNLVDNSFKFSPEGTPVLIDVSLSKYGNLICAVMDEGQGMSEENVASVHTPFSQADMSSNRLVDGLGLGLAITKAIAERHDGQLVIKSLAGRGTIASIIFPAARVLHDEKGGQCYAVA